MKTAALNVRALTRLFKALGDETRVRIVALLSHGELCVCHIQDALELAQPTASRHLATLRAADLVEDRRDGSWIYYRLRKPTDPECEAQLHALIGSFSGNKTIQSDAAKLRSATRARTCK